MNWDHMCWKPEYLKILFCILIAVALSFCTRVRSEHNRHECIPKILIDEEPYPIPPGLKNKPQIKKFT